MKILALVLTFLLTLSPPPRKAFANTTQKIPVCFTVNGNFIKSDTNGFLENGYSMLPIRAVCESLNADTILWNQRTSTAEIKKDGTTIVLKKDSPTAQLNGKKVSLDAPSVIVQDRFYVPVRFVAEALNAKVLWDKNTLTVHLEKNDESVPPHLIGSRDYTDHDLYWLARIVHAESAGEPMEGKIAVANVVQNRVKSKLFPNSIYEVIFDRKYGVQFSPILNGTIYNTPTGDCIAAAKRALHGENHANESLYFLNPVIAQSFWIVENRTFFKSIGNHDFYL